MPDRMLLMSSTALFFRRSAIPAGCVRWLAFLWPIDETLEAHCSFRKSISWPTPKHISHLRDRMPAAMLVNALCQPIARRRSPNPCIPPPEIGIGLRGGTLPNPCAF